MNSQYQHNNHFPYGLQQQNMLHNQQQQQHAPESQYMYHRKGNEQEEQEIYQLLLDLFSGKEREKILANLIRKRETNDDLGLYIWHSFGMIRKFLISETFDSVTNE